MKLLENEDLRAHFTACALTGTMTHSHTQGAAKCVELAMEAGKLMTQAFLADRRKREEYADGNRAPEAPAAPVVQSRTLDAIAQSTQRTLAGENGHGQSS